MKKLLIVTVMIMWGSVGARAQTGIIEVIKAGIVKVIKAVDLRIQRIQNETIAAQNVQKVIETKMQELKLGEIAGWIEKQKELYRSYYEELYSVKTIVGYYKNVKDIILSQVQLVKEYKKAISIAKSDKHFTDQEIDLMVKVYTGILDESAKNIERVHLAVSSFTTQMSDAQRMKIIREVSEKLEENKNDLRQFNQQSAKLSLQRARDEREVSVTKRLYGIE
jgi:hypothetical protein